MASHETTTESLEPNRNRSPNARLSRSPHPYHRQSQDLPDRIWTASRPPALGEPVAINPSDYFTTRPLSRQSCHLASPSDSGTEADDEKPILKALTAPPLRPRKGLRSLEKAGPDQSPSPLLTPSIADDSYVSEEPRHAARRAKGIEKAAKGVAKRPTPEQKLKQRAIIARRVVEILLLGLVGFLTYTNQPLSLRSSLLLHLGVTLVLYATYLWRTAIWPSGRQFRSTQDPAPLLYPLIVPVLVALCLPESGRLVAFNFTLSFCTIPLPIIPFQDFHAHWLISLLPQSYGWLTHQSGYGQAVSSRGTDLETIAVLFPLHYCLLTCIEFLTTTSLLASEVQLLSVGLINLLLFASSPQAYILKALLWIGGIALFCTCKQILRWTVSLARVPKWRFRKVQRKIFYNQPILAAVDDTVGGWLSSIFSHKVEDSSDSESENDALRARLKQFKAPYKTDQRANVNSERSKGANRQRRTSIDDLRSRKRGSGGEGHFQGRSRRHTLPTAPSALPDLPQLRRTATTGLARFRDQPKYYLSLTGAQATLLKCLYAGIVYGVVVLTIIGPIRVYIGWRALNGEEPFGWALGYLFGDLPSFRLQTVLWCLDDWICLPQNNEDPPKDLGLADYLRTYVFGAANTRLLICAYCITIIVSGVMLVMHLSSLVEVDTRRKVFHGMMVAMFGITGFIDPSLISLAFALILAIFLLLDLFRASQLPPISKPLTIFLAPYVDGRDFKGPVVVSHLFLLTGCAVPFWLGLAALQRNGEGAFAGWEVRNRELSMLTGVVCVGMGDAAASLIGRRFGRRRWTWGGGKSLEGSLAFVVAVSVGLLASRIYLMVGGWPMVSQDSWLVATPKIILASCAASLTEAVLTGANDNVLVPIILWLWVRALGL